MKKIFFIVALAFLLALPMIASAQDTIGTFRRGDEVNVFQMCENCGSITISSITSPNSTIIVSNVSMTSTDNYYYNYTLESSYTELVGVYTVNGYDDGDEVFAYDFTITESGTPLLEGNAWIFLGLVILFLSLFGFCLFLFKKSNHIAIKTLGFYGCYATVLALCYTTWRYSLDWMTVTSFIPAIFYWGFVIMLYALPLLLLCTFAFIIWLMITVAPMKRMLERGEVHDTSYESRIKRDLRRLKREKDWRRTQGTW